MTATTKHETVCIRRSGFSLLHTEGADFAAKVTYQSYLKDGHRCFGGEVKQELLIPLYGRWA